MSVVKAIPTRHKGYLFRSRLEARWAVFFDVIGAKWSYEVEGYENDQGVRYLPDFFLHNVTLRGVKNPERGLCLEVKPDHYETNEHQGDAEKYYMCSPLILVRGMPSNVQPLPGSRMTGEQYLDQGATEEDCGLWWDNFMHFVKCYRCGCLKVEYDEGHYMECPECGYRADGYHPDLVDGCHAAQEAQFEHHRGA